MSNQYLGCIEVFESRGIQVCEEAVKALKSVGGVEVVVLVGWDGSCGVGGVVLSGWVDA